MLSTENPPSDLPCQLKNNSNTDDERASDNNQVDLLKSGLDDKNPLPNFSIRDYVFSTRGKDIKNNWPFSQENLQLCLKYGVKDVLPPFQSLDSVRNPSLLMKCAAENLSYSDVKLSELSDDHIVGQKLTVDIENINSSRSEEDREFPSTTTSQLSCSDLNSILTSKSPYLEPEAEYLPGSPTEFAVRASDKVESNIQNPVKKCRLIVKVNNNTGERKSNEDLAANTSAISETMASKVCPVCKTFSSSSNTTLNAHIDQCLSGESTVKWTANPKVIKHRIKPRKTRLMVDIYQTALHGTLEDLDRRNGTNWASNLGFPAQDLDKNKTHSSVNENGAVGIDSKGIKLRSLSKLSDLPSKSMTNHDCGPSKLVEIDKGSKFDSSKKKKNHVQKHKLLKHPLYGQRSCPPCPNHLLKCPPCGPKSSYPRLDHNPGLQINNGQQKQFLPEGYKEGDLTQPLTACDQMKSDGVGLLKQWAGSTRTGLKKKMNFEHENQAPNKTMKYMRESGGPSRSRTSSYANPLLPIESHKRKDNLVCNPHDGCAEQHHRRKRPGLKKNLGRKHLDFKKPRLNYTSGSDDEEAVASRSGICQHDNLSGTVRGNAAQRKMASGKPLTNGNRVLKARKKRRGFVNTGKDLMSLEGSSDTLSPESDSDGVVPADKSGVLDEVEIHDEFVREPTTYNITDGEAFISFSKSLDSTFHEFTGPNVECVSQHYIKAFEEHSPAEMDADDAKRDYYVDVDPIPIPGPPGSFLPSPGRMGSEDFHGNSSLHDEQEVVHMDSDSPISTMSSVSNSIAARSDSGSVIILPMQSHVLHESQCDIAEGRIDRLTDEERELIQPCCCSRKDGVLQSSRSFNYQESQLLRRRTMTSLTVLSQEKHVAGDSKNKIQNSNMRSESLPGKEVPEPETTLVDSPMGGYASEVVSHNSEAKYQACVDCESPTPSTPNPVLRLMGKNLMVVNKDENLSPQTRPAHSNSSIVIEHPGLMFYIDNGLSTSNNRNEPHSSGHILSRGPSVFDNIETTVPAQHFDFIESPSNFRPQQLSAHPSVVLHSSASFGGSRSFNCHEYASGYSLTPDQLGPNIRVDSQRTYDTEQVQTPIPQVKHKEIIVIDESPESETSLSIKATSMASQWDSRHVVNPFYNYQTRGYPLYTGLQ